MLETKLCDLTAQQYVELTQGASAIAWAVQIGGIAALVALWRVGRRALERVRIARAPARSSAFAHANLPPRPDWSAPCPACGCIIDRDDAELLTRGLLIDRWSSLGSAIDCGRPNPAGLELVDQRAVWLPLCTACLGEEVGSPRNYIARGGAHQPCAGCSGLTTGRGLVLEKSESGRSPDAPEPPTAA